MRWNDNYQFHKDDRFMIKNIVTGNNNESHPTIERAIAACNTLNRWAVERCGKAARCVVIDTTTNEQFYSDLKYKVGIV